MTALVVAARDILDWLHQGGWRCCVIGGMAVQRWGEPRLTQDVDVTVLVDPGSAERLVDEVLERFPGRRVDSRTFALTYRVLLVRAANGVAIDLALGSTGFESESVERSTPWEVEPGCPIRTCSAEDLIVHKLIAGRPRDLADIDGIVMRQFARLDLERIRTWIAGFAGLKEDTDLGRPLEMALVAARRRRGEGTPR
jgi:hypothetical protein